jgi:regulator of replication initiation timing
MKFFNREPFDDQKVEALRIHLTNLAANGDPSDYQVVLDNMEVVPRTSNVDLFTSFYDLISDKSKSLNIYVYSGTTRHKRSYSYYFADVTTQEGSLNGVDTQQMIEQQVALKTLEMQNQQYDQQVKSFREEIVSLETENNKLREENESLKEDLQKTVGDNGLAANIMGGVERMIKHFVPGNNNQQGTLAGTEQQRYSPPAGTVNISQAQFDEFRSFAAMAETFEKAEFGKVLHIVKFLSENKPAIDETLNFLTEEENNTDDDSQDNHH